MSIRANCPDCGDVSFENEAITIRPCVDDPKKSSYFFVCPSCGTRVSSLASWRIIDLLAACATKVEPWFLPVELFEEKLGPPITVDDIIDFHNALVGQ